MPRKLSVLLTGANGLLGRKLAEQLLLRGHFVYGMVHSQPSKPIAGIDYLIVNLNTNWPLSSLPDTVDAVIHLAQSAHFREFPEKALDVFQVNIASTARLLDYARRVGVRKFVYASSGGVYGNGRDAFRENSPIVFPGQLGYYLGSKLCGEVMVQSYAAVFQVVLLRFFFMYGPGQNRTMLLPRLMDSIKSGKPVILQGNDGIRINPVHVVDAAAATIAAVEQAESATFNISGPDVLSLRQICDAMGEFLGVEPQFQIINTHPNDLVGDNTAMRKKLCAPSRRLVHNLSDLIADS